MKKSKLLFCGFLAFLFLLPASLNAHDFGLLLNQRFRPGGTGGSTEGDYRAALIPRFSALLGDSGDLFLSASLMVVYENNGWNLVPELLRNEFSWRFGNADVHLGRMMYSDPMNFIAAGLFDGARLSYHTMMGSFGIGVWYTGLLYKNRAKIVMTGDDAASISEELDWGDFFNTYFASRRLMMVLSWEHPSFAELMRLNVAFIGQVDLNGRDHSYHNQYFIASAALPFRQFIFGFGGAVETSQSGNSGSTDFYTAFAADIGIHWMPPAPFYNMLSFTGRFTSGRTGGGSLSAFTPITALPHGNILRAEIPGLSILGLNYTARLHHTFSAALSVLQFVRSDTETFAAYPLNGRASNNHFLGTELFGRIIWSPVSDLNLNLGAGTFLPSLGNVAPNADARWRIDMAVTAALR